MDAEAISLRKLKFLSDFSETDINKIIQISTIREFGVKDIIIEESQELSEVHILIEGMVVLGINVPKKGKLNLGTIHPGQLFSWSALFPPYISTASATATTPVKVFSINARQIERMSEEDKSFGFTLMKNISDTLTRRLSDTRFQLVNIATI